MKPNSKPIYIFVPAGELLCLGDEIYTLNNGQAGWYLVKSNWIGLANPDVGMVRRLINPNKEVVCCLEPSMLAIAEAYQVSGLGKVVSHELITLVANS